MGKTVSFINMKGGVGKTTLAVNVGYTLSKKFGKKVLVIDVDPQMNATQYTLDDSQILEIMENPNQSIYGILKTEPTIPPITKESNDDGPLFEGIINISDNLDLIPSHLSLMSIYLDDEPLTLFNYIKEIRDSYDIIIIDSPPTISPYTKISLLASDAYVVPMKTEALSLFGLPLLQNYIDRLTKQFDRDLDFLGIVLTMVTPTFKVYKEIKPKIASNPDWREKLFDAELKQATAVTHALSPEEKSESLPYIIELNDYELKRQMLNITEELMQRLRL
jgi:chromosome partitioning protein